MVFFGVIIGFIVSKEGKPPNSKKIQVIVNMDISQNSLQIQLLNGMAQFYKCFIKIFIVHLALITKPTWKTIFFSMDKRVLKSLTIHKT
jgi:hypothetical protein